MTHDCSSPCASGLSVNKQVQQESLKICFCGFFLLSIIHMISAMWGKWPTKRIFTGKRDWMQPTTESMQKIYDRIDLNINRLKMSFLYLRLPFSTTPAPVQYTTIKKNAIYLGNDLLRDELWDTTYINSPHRNLLP